MLTSNNGEAKAGDDDELLNATDHSQHDAVLADEGNESSYSRLTTPGYGSDSDCGTYSGQRPQLNPGQAVKRTRADREESEEYDPSNPMGIERERYKKRVPAKVIDRLWTKLEPEQFRSLDNLFNVALNKSLERYKGSANEHYKVAEAQRVLSHHWASEKLPKSFLARLKMTKLPPVKSLQVRMRGAKAEEYDLLDIDQAQRKKAMYEAYLLAENQQLQELQAYHKSIKKAFDEDSKYLEEFKKTTASIQAQTTRETEEKKKLFHLDVPHAADDINLSNIPTPIPDNLASASFNPNKDSDVKQLLGGIMAKIDEKAPQQKLSELLGICDELDEFQSKFDDGRFFRML